MNKKFERKLEKEGNKPKDGNLELNNMLDSILSF